MKQVDNIFRQVRKRQFSGAEIPIRFATQSRRLKARRRAVALHSLKVGGGILIVLSLSFGFLFRKTLAQTADLVSFWQDGHYLVLFQNNAELRPTGGFIGSLALATIRDKKVVSFEIDPNIYNLDDQFKKHYYVPQPKPFEEWMPKNSWSLHDSNWEADFSQASRDIQWFYETSRAQEIDGIVAVNASVLEDIVTLTGPIDLPEYGLRLDEENITASLQREIEINYFYNPEHLKENKPKKILQQLYPELLEKINRSAKAPLIKLFFDGLEKKDIQFYFRDGRQEAALANNWAGEISRPDANYFFINNSNMGGGKSSLSTHQQVEYDLNGSQLDLTIRRTNLPRSDGYPTGTNENYIRIYLPKGSKITSQILDGQTIGELDVATKYDKNEFGFWFATPLNQTRIAQLKFEIPDQTSQSLLIQKQSGARHETYTIRRQGQILFDGTLTKDETI